ncbi:DNA processing protein DprA [Thermosipho melanesiensis]|uniref:DNA protecting protein DprA n=2 Tax=Thermosipho melanesiensis TaxID=46541 RepID=A6LNF2_THEM4|nr:DNA-processing protein DprA [Thermosipho melanesiensis]ABR31453.1 DNA protecting protein DprA [Thermosipho melanesiensis BI429]APT74512.1 DNA processing protein DprA [Thermosipho melanesiensis]OOC36466.1 DNA processing protein DprA [Thermosipho melanesiensis]OOC37284.1 DNA processing protein DprA [Thermosipho melanesiensis]OOC38036.1 DNA processing protein DprA [Thermosipho melanesiensis]
MDLRIAIWHYLGHSLKEIRKKLALVKQVEKDELYFKLKSWLSKEGNFLVTYFDEDYPESLKNIWNPPVVLFGKGNKELLSKKSFAIVGTRLPTEYGRKVAYSFSKRLSSYFVIVSGMARGIDAFAHKNARETIAVLGNGVDYCYPKENRELYLKIIKEGCVVSEYLPWERPRRDNFRARNRIIAGISEGVLIVEGKLKSGTMITANYALDFGKDVFCVPGNIYSENSQTPNFLIKNGAFLVTNPDDIVEYYFMRGVLYGSNKKY